MITRSGQYIYIYIYRERAREITLVLNKKKKKKARCYHSRDGIKLKNYHNY